jgi:hypothetical protein
MKRVLLSLGLALLLITSIGCHQGALQSGGCGNTSCNRCGLLGAQRGAPTPVPRMPRGGPPQQAQTGAGGMGAVGYPYYTVRAPRDFLHNQPPSIGP